MPSYHPKSKSNPEGFYGKIAIMALLDFARCDARLTYADMVYLQALGSRVGKTTKGLRTQASIAKEMGISRATVNKHEKRLIQYGYIKKERRPEPGYRNKYQYTFNLKLLEKPRTTEGLQEYHKTTKFWANVNSDTPKGVTERHSQRSQNSDTPKGYTKKTTIEKNLKPQGTGFKPLSSGVEQALLGLAEKKLSKNWE